MKTRKIEAIDGLVAIAGLRMGCKSSPYFIEFENKIHNFFHPILSVHQHGRFDVTRKQSTGKTIKIKLLLVAFNLTKLPRQPSLALAIELR